MMFAQLGILVSKHWLLVIVIWLLAVGLLSYLAPSWDDVTHDGDLAYLPSDRPSVRGEALLEEAFPHNRAKSQFVLVVARDNGPATKADNQIADRLAVLFKILGSKAGLERAAKLENQSAEAEARGDLPQARRLRALVTGELNATLESLDWVLATDPSAADAYHNRFLVHSRLGNQEQAISDAQEALKLNPELATLDGSPAPDRVPNFPLLDVWNRDTPVVGEKLISSDKQAQLVILQMATEFMATENVALLDYVVRTVDQVKGEFPAASLENVHIGISGAAAVGGDMLTSASESIRNTEKFTILLVVVILTLVYRSPLLVAVPLATILISLVTAMSLVAVFTQLNHLPGMDWWNFKVFKTTKIFVVVILFGAGTDFCLFLIARYREELKSGLAIPDAIARALEGVGDALVASALTTIGGLSMMFFADFGKFRNSGPAIGMCLLVTLVACVTFAPAMLRALGTNVFWPYGTEATAARQQRGKFQRNLWENASHWIVAYPGRILVGSVVLLFPLAWFGSQLPPFRFTGSSETNGPHDARQVSWPGLQFPPAAWYRLREGREFVTYDLLNEIHDSRPSKRGTAILKRHFPVGEAGPVILLAKKTDGGLDPRINTRARRAIERFTEELYVDGVLQVRSVVDPLGDQLGDRSKRRGIFDSRRFTDIHRLTRSIYLTEVPALEGDVARFELILEHPPFSLEATKVLEKIDQKLEQISNDSGSFWSETEFVYAGTTAAIRDLREVTEADNVRIMVLVVIAVLAILLIILRRPVVCLFLILSVLFSYFVTIGATELFFATLYGDSFAGLDWKLPLFLFVILVALGQDYNIYLTTRVFEEQREHGPIEGLRLAIVRTGGIITSCGVIMAGTFISMTSGSLRGMSELGFALALGVLLDTFVVRPILVPSFLALICREKSTRTTRSES